MGSLFLFVISAFTTTTFNRIFAQNFLQPCNTNAFYSNYQVKH